MSNYTYLKAGTGGLFINMKNGNENAPDFKGNIKLNLVLLEEVIYQAKQQNQTEIFISMSSWKKKDDQGETYLSISPQVRMNSIAEPIDTAFPASLIKSPVPVSLENLDNDIPF